MLISDSRFARKSGLQHVVVLDADGRLEIKISQESASAYGIDLQGNQRKLYNSTHKSGQLSSWNKFCFTGGYLEVAVKLPGEHSTYGLWPSLWMLGNIGKAGYINSTTGGRRDLQLIKEQNMCLWFTVSTHYVHTMHTL